MKKAALLIPWLGSPFACASEPALSIEPQQADSQIPDFVLTAYRSEHLIRAKMYIGTDGRIEKYGAYVTKEGIPDWVHQLADEKLGQGKDEEYEIETYADGSEVFEVRRCVADKSNELSVKRDRSLKYIERQLDAGELPEAVRNTVRSISNFAADRYAVKEGPHLKECQVRGKIGDVPYRARIKEDGRLVALQNKVEGSFEIAIPQEQGG